MEFTIPVLTEIAEHVADVAARHHNLAASMAGTGRLYAPARRAGLTNLDGPDWEQKLFDINHGRWTPLNAGEITPLLVAYRAADKISQQLRAGLGGRDVDDAAQTAAALTALTRRQDRRTDIAAIRTRHQPDPPARDRPCRRCSDIHAEAAASGRPGRMTRMPATHTRLTGDARWYPAAAARPRWSCSPLAWVARWQSGLHGV